MDKIYYHGSNSKFTTFDKSKIRENKLGLCFNFTDDYSMAYQYGDNILKVHLDLNNPITEDDLDHVLTYEEDCLLCDIMGFPKISKERFEQEKGRYSETIGSLYKVFKMKPKFIQFLQKLGYDGVSFPEDHHYGVFEPEQIHIIGDEMKESVNERLEEINSGIYATKSAYDIINWMKNKPKPYRIIYDSNINQYFIGDAFDYIHQDMLEEAFYSGFYPDMLSANEVDDYSNKGMENKTMLFFSFDPEGGGLIDSEKSSDGYTRKYVYDFGTIYSHEFTPLEDFELYKILGEPVKKETVLEHVDFKKLNTILEGFLKDYEEIATIIKDDNGFNVIEDNKVLLDKSYPSLKRMLRDISNNMEE